MKRKVLCAILTASMVLGMTACGGSSGTASKAAEAAASSAAAAIESTADQVESAAGEAAEAAESVVEEAADAVESAAADAESVVEEAADAVDGNHRSAVRRRPLARVMYTRSGVHFPAVFSLFIWLYGVDYSAHRR